MMSHTQFLPGTPGGLGGAGRLCQARPVTLAGRGAGSGPPWAAGIPLQAASGSVAWTGRLGTRAQVCLAVAQPPGAACHGGSTVWACQMHVAIALAGRTVRAVSSHTKLG